MRKRFFKLVVVSGIVLLSPSLSYAQWYVGGGTGKTNIETDATITDQSTPTTSNVIDDSDSYYKLFGGFRVTPAFALEFGYNNLGEYKRDFTSAGGFQNFKMKANTMLIEGVGNVDLGSNWRFLGKLGLAYWKATADYSDSTPFSDSGSDNGLDPVLGLGFEYGFKMAKGRLGLRAEWEQYQNIGEGVSYKDNANTTRTINGVDVNTFGFAVIYDF